MNSLNKVKTIFHKSRTVALNGFESYILLSTKKENLIHLDEVSFLVDDIGLEPMTFRTSSGCSSQLS